MTQHSMFYVGTYTRTMPHVQAKSEGIYLCRLHTESGAMDVLDVTKNVDNPSYVALTSNGRYLYAVNEVGDFGGEASGAVSAFAIDEKTGALTFLNQQPTGGAAPCHVSVDSTGQFVLCANYTGGSICAHPVQDDGSLGTASAFIQHMGSSVNPQRQQEPHAHSINLSPNGRFAMVADLGMDKVMVYQLERTTGGLIPNDPAFVQTPAGAGPRHFGFHPSRRFAYVINELGSTVTAFAYDDNRGLLEVIQTIPTLPEGFTGRSHCADIHVHPNGKFVYGSNRGHDSIAIFAVDAETGSLTALGHESTQGKVPRGFALDPTGTLLLAANQNTDNIVSYHIDQETGQLTPTGHQVNVPTPVCIKFMP